MREEKMSMISYRGDCERTPRTEAPVKFLLDIFENNHKEGQAIE
jgi:hypothetical protein